MSPPAINGDRKPEFDEEATMRETDEPESTPDKPGPLEKRDLKIGFTPITCATPIIMAEPLEF
jgi:nitrate/nitrite transport system substrate-binding protein